MKLLTIILGLLTFSSANAAAQVTKVAEGSLLEKTFEVIAEECISNLKRADQWEVSCKVVSSKMLSPDEILVKADRENATFPLTETGPVGVIVVSDLEGYTLTLTSSRPINDAQAQSMIQNFTKNRIALTTMSFLSK